MFYVWAALIVLGQVKPLWKWIQRNRAKNWPITSGTIESATVDEAKRGFFSSSAFGRSPSHVAELNYVYSVGGIGATGVYKRGFGTEDEAWDFVRDLKGKPIAVHYNPDKPSASALSEPSIDTALQNRAPEPASSRPAPTKSISPLLAPFLWVFVAMSAIGLALSLYVHLGAVRGQRVAPEPFFWALHIGIFVVWFPAIYVAKQRIGNLQRKDFWKVVLKGSPEWMRYMVYGFFGYALVNFLYFLPQAPTGTGNGTTPAIVWRGFSGHRMAFYSAALAILYTEVNSDETTRTCLNGHPLWPGASFCERCGQPVIRN
jgi:hypothetical protein